MNRRTQVPVYLTPELLSYLDAVREDRSRSAFLAHLLKMYERAEMAQGLALAARAGGH